MLLKSLAIAALMAAVQSAEPPLAPPPAPAPPAALPETVIPAPAPGIELRVLPEGSDAAYRVDEFGADGKSDGAVRCEDERALTRYMTRAAKDSSAPTELRLVVMNNCTLERVWAAVKAASAAGYTTVRYYGCHPPGCSIRTGATDKQQRYEGAAIPIKQLLQSLAKVSEYC